MVSPINPIPVAPSFKKLQDLEKQEDAILQFIQDERRLERKFRNLPRAMAYMRAQGHKAMVTLARIFKHEYPDALSEVPLDILVDIIDGDFFKNLKLNLKNISQAIEKINERLTFLTEKKDGLEDELSDATDHLNNDLLPAKTAAEGAIGDLQDTLADIQAARQSFITDAQAYLTTVNGTLATYVVLADTEFVFSANPTEQANLVAYQNAIPAFVSARDALAAAAVPNAEPSAISAAENNLQTAIQSLQNKWLVVASLHPGTGAQITPLINSIQSATNNFSAEITFDESVLAGLPTIAEVNADIEEAEETLDEVEEEIETANLEIATLTQQIADTEDRIDNQTAKLAANEEDLSRIEGFLANINNLGEVNGIIFTLQGSLIGLITPDDLELVRGLRQVA